MDFPVADQVSLSWESEDIPIDWMIYYGCEYIEYESDLMEVLVPMHFKTGRQIETECQRIGKNMHGLRTREVVRTSLRTTQ